MREKSLCSLRAARFGLLSPAACNDLSAQSLALVYTYALLGGSTVPTGESHTRGSLAFPHLALVGCAACLLAAAWRARDSLSRFWATRTREYRGPQLDRVRSRIRSLIFTCREGARRVVSTTAVAPGPHRDTRARVPKGDPISHFFRFFHAVDTCTLYCVAASRAFILCRYCKRRVTR